jgi:hypothetical protein
MAPLLAPMHVLLFATLDMSLDTHRTVTLCCVVLDLHASRINCRQCSPEHVHQDPQERSKLRMPRRNHSSVSVTSLILIDCLLRFASLLHQMFDEFLYSKFDE